ncbi:hypothetical protein D3C76_1318190 [compost metagenome]
MQIGRQLDSDRPVVAVERRQGAGETALQIVPQRDHIILVHARHGAALATFAQLFEQLQHSRFVEVVRHFFRVEVIEVGIGQDLGQFHFGEQLELQWEIDRPGSGHAAEARHQPRRLLAGPRRVDMGEKVQAAATQFGLQLAVGTRCQGGDQVGFTGLRQAEETHCHG